MSSSVGIYIEPHTNYVGIGTTVPASLLHVSVRDNLAGLNTPLEMIRLEWADTGIDQQAGFGTKIAFYTPNDNNVGTTTEGAYIAAVRESGTEANSSTSITFGNKVNANASTLETVRILSDGKVGLGTAAPTSTLTVWGDARIGTMSNTNTQSTNYGRWQNQMVTIDPDQSLSQLYNYTSTANETLSANRTSYNIQNVYINGALGSSTSGSQVTVYGMRNSIYNGLTGYGSGHLQNVFGIYNYIENRASNADNYYTVENAYGIFNYLRQYRAGGITSNAYGTYNYMVHSAGTYVNSYGCYVDSDPSILNSYGVYCTGEQKNYLSGNVGIGTTTPLLKLHVEGSLYASGCIIQVQSVTVTSAFTITLSATAGTFSNITGLAVTITPKRSSSRIMITFNLTTSSANSGYVRLTRNGTAIAIGDADATKTSISRVTTGRNFHYSDGNHCVALNMTFIDSPNTTSALTYQLQLACDAASSVQYINRTINDTNSASGYRSISTITACEIGQ